MFLYKIRFPLLAMGMLSLLAALFSGLMRLGLDLTFFNAELPEAHGPLMVAAFLGTVIGLERAVALDKPWGYLAPLFAGLGGLSGIAGASHNLTALLVTLSASVLILMYALILTRQLELFNGVMVLGAVCLLIGNIFWLSGETVDVFALWWVSFLVLTIAGERLELSRVLSPTPRVKGAFVAAMALFLFGAVVSTVHQDVGAKIAGLGMFFISLWMVLFDVARNTVKQKGLTRYVAVCLLSGYFWLGFGGLAMFLMPVWEPGYMYDAVLHSIFLGFTFTMIFGHAPIIFPAVLRVPVPYSPLFYAHLLILHISLLFRIIGDLLIWDAGRSLGGAVNVLAVLLFLGNTVFAVVKGLAAKKG